MKYFSLFSGIGGFELGIKKGFSKHGENKTTCIGYSEIDKYAIQIYQKHFPKHKNYGNATKIDTNELPEFDLLCAGFPCQSFSIAGGRGGFNDTRGALFFEIARIIKTKRPEAVLLENVKGLLNHEKGKTFRIIIQTLDELGYNIQWMVLNSKFFGVAQNRERVFIIGHLRRTSRQQIFPIRKSSEKSDKMERTTERRGTGVEDEISSTIDSNYWKGGRAGRSLIIVHNIHEGFKEGKEKIYPELNQIGNIDQRGHNSLWGRVYSPNGTSPSLNAHREGLGAKTGLILQHDKDSNCMIRKLTPLECERLQGFPDNWTEGLSDTQRYKCLGNAVTVNVVQFIVEKIIIWWQYGDT